MSVELFLKLNYTKYDGFSNILVFFSMFSDVHRMLSGARKCSLDVLMGLLGLMGQVGFLGHVGFLGLVSLMGWVGLMGLVGLVGLMSLVSLVGHGGGRFPSCISDPELHLVPFSFQSSRDSQR